MPTLAKVNDAQSSSQPTSRVRQRRGNASYPISLAQTPVPPDPSRANRQSWHHGMTHVDDSSPDMSQKHCVTLW